MKTFVIPLPPSRVKGEAIMSKYPRFWINFAVGILGLAAGASNLYESFAGDEETKTFVIGVVCMILASAWLVYSFFTNKSKTDQSSTKGRSD